MAGPALAGDISIKITGVRSDEGTMRVALFDNKVDFPNGHSVLVRNVPAHTGDMMIVLEAIPAGTYAIALHHDENDNGRMDLSVVGMPQEGYGFSNDAPVFLGAPPFSDAAVSVPEEGKQIAIRIVY
jgi:uncharacterized protein (DUF2141 family)